MLPAVEKMLRDSIATGSVLSTADCVNGFMDPNRESGVSHVIYSLSSLMRLGLISIVPGDGVTRLQLTPRGMQYVADYEIMRQGREELSHLPLAISPNEYAILHLFDKPRALDEFPDIHRVSVLIPASNEAKNIAVLLDDLANKLPGLSEVVVIDKSTDETAEVARTLGAKVIRQNGVGKGDALRQAFEADYSGDIIVALDADGSNRIEEIPALVEEIVKGADVVKGSRFLKGGGSTDITRVRKIGNRLFTSIVNLLWSTDYTDLCYGFVAYRKEALPRLAGILESNHFEIETEIFIKARKIGLKVVEVPSVELMRRFGDSKLRGVHDSLRIFNTILHEMMTSSRIAPILTLGRRIGAVPNYPIRRPSTSSST